jgi:hypothetical protein
MEEGRYGGVGARDRECLRVMTSATVGALWPGDQPPGVAGVGGGRARAGDAPTQGECAGGALRGPGAWQARGAAGRRAAALRDNTCDCRLTPNAGATTPADARPAD